MSKASFTVCEDELLNSGFSIGAKNRDRNAAQFLRDFVRQQQSAAGHDHVFDNREAVTVADIDALVPATQEAGVMIRSALMVLPDRVAKDIDPVWFDEGENIRVADAFVVDLNDEAVEGITCPVLSKRCTDDTGKRDLTGFKAQVATTVAIHFRSSD